MTRFNAASAALAFTFMAACHDAALSPTEPIAPPSDEQANVATPGIGWIYRDGTPVKVYFEIRDGRAIFEGDIDLGPVERIARTREELLGIRGEGARYGVVIDPEGYRWPNGQVPYVIEGNFLNPSRVQAAIAHIQSRATGVNFYQRSSEGNYVIFRRYEGADFCGQSNVGRVGGGQVIEIGDSTTSANCNTGVVIHEIGHALGFWHEQSRCDRDSYVEILWANVRPGEVYHRQFDKYCAPQLGRDVGTYEEGSIMHYPSNAFGINGAQTIRSLRGREYLMGQRDSLATVDTYTINWMYPPYRVQGVSVSYSGTGTPTISWNASPSAIGYGVSLVQVYEEYDASSGRYLTWDASSEGVGTTTGLSLQDPSPDHTYTGNSVCLTDRGDGSWYSFTFYYEVIAEYAGGLGSQTSRVVADVAPCPPPWY